MLSSTTSTVNAARSDGGFLDATDPALFELNPPGVMIFPMPGQMTPGARALLLNVGVPNGKPRDHITFPVGKANCCFPLIKHVSVTNYLKALEEIGCTKDKGVLMRACAEKISENKGDDLVDPRLILALSSYARIESHFDDLNEKPKIKEQALAVLQGAMLGLAKTNFLYAGLLSNVSDSQDNCGYPEQNPSFFAGEAAVALMDKKLITIDQKILDLGAGDGSFIKKLIEEGASKVIGLEPNEKLIPNVCSTELKSALLPLSSLEYVEKNPNESFDVIHVGHFNPLITGREPGGNFTTSMENFFRAAAKLVTSDGMCLIGISCINPESISTFN